ncbi:MAG: DNA-directed RNA polymerase subunit beta [Alphaproteobacteria bacterium]|nr:DNA-directed RNA polymerase subunit beta [Alphaproteobacteria bacterium]
MDKSLVSRKRLRKSFGKIEEIASMPNLIEVQKKSFADFLQADVPSNKRENTGLQEVFKSIFPISDYSEKMEIDFVKYEFDAPKYDHIECVYRDMTFASPMKATLRLSVFDIDEKTGSKSIKDIKEQEVYLLDMPRMTDDGTFIINGTQRVVVSQMHRSPGIFFGSDDGKTSTSGKVLHTARIIPYRGSWLDIEFDPKDKMNVRIDRRRKLPLTSLLYVLDSEDTEQYKAECAANNTVINEEEISGMSKEEIVNYFYKAKSYKKVKGGYEITFDPENHKGTVLKYDLVDAKSGEVVAKKGTRMTIRALKKLADLKSNIVPEEHLIGNYFSEDMINEDTGEILFEAGSVVTADDIEIISKLKEFKLISTGGTNPGSYLLETMSIDKNSCREEALLDIYRVLRPGEPPTVDSASTLFNAMMFTEERYDLSAVGRVKINARLGLDFADTQRTITKKDILEIIKTLMNIKDGKDEVDDIDSLGNRRIRSVGELLENQIRIGLVRMERAIKEKMSSVDDEGVMPHDIVTTKSLTSTVREFFGMSQLSQLMDQNNPLAEVTHKRRISALGPGGLNRERAGFEVRDVHPTHYGRICPIETPEGPNIGLINSLSTYSKINKYGFIETPYRKVIDGKVTEEIVYLSADEEGRHTIAQANASLNEDKSLAGDLISCRFCGDYIMANPLDIDLMDVSPKQVVSVASSLIPFLENDDANRALMGSNMMRQAVPLLQADSPIVGTGIEKVVAQDSGSSIIAKRTGIVDQVDGERIVVRATEEKDPTAPIVDIYRLIKFTRSNASTAINQKPLVKVGDFVRAGDIICDGASTELGELALGKNMLVAYMPWNGYNFEDSILISERVVKDDVMTSINIEKFEVSARDTKLGEEEITRDIPNTGEEALKNLDEAGIIHIGASVKAGDILVGKVTPKGESVISPEEKLLRAIFGEKAADVKDSSLRVPPGVEGTVVDVRVFSRRGIKKDERTIKIEKQEIEKLAKDRDDEKRILQRNFFDQISQVLIGQEYVSGAKEIAKAAKLTQKDLDTVTKGKLQKIVVADEDVNKAVSEMTKTYEQGIKDIDKRFDAKIEKAQAGADLLPGVMKQVKVFIAQKRKLSPGDKMAGRHGNKGVVSRVLAEEDMPYLEDGTPVDIVLNPLGVPSRMNIGQILETHLGWAMGHFGKQINETLQAVQENKAKMEDVRNKIEEAYGTDVYNAEFKDLNDDAIVEVAKNLKKGVPIATPVFDGAKESDIEEMLEKVGLDTSAQVTLFDGRTGEAFDRKVTVGYVYMLKLHHLIDDKMHARSIGPYSLVTQQPLGGKAQFGGQRFGEMEVWALEAYGASYILQEMLTIKSDDIAGRTKAYDAIIRGDNSFEVGVPESFNVLVKELQGLGINLELNNKEL